MPEPTSVVADGNYLISWVPTITTVTAPLATELNAAGAVNLTEYITSDGWKPTTTETAITDGRASTTQNFKKAGRVDEDLEIMYVWQAQGTPTDNKAKTTLVNGTAGFIVVRWGLAYSTTFVAAQKVDVYPAKCGVQRRMAPEANSVLKIAQTIYITGTVNRDATVA